MNKEKIETILREILKWLKIALAIFAFLLGLLDEYAELTPSVSPIEQEVVGDSLAISLWGLIVNITFGCPLMLSTGLLIGNAFA